ncbi:MAG: beta-propeller fold lactonase family protein [Muribaculaceae bacterium]|nr:beta-propeller fold lactonase family protein [Muribaculaceae bacterium]
MESLYYTGSYGADLDATVAVVGFDETTGRIRVIDTLKGVANASFVVPAHGHLLAIGESGADSRLATVSLKGDGAGFGDLAVRQFAGVDPCHLDVSSTGEIAVANYSSGDVVIFKNIRDFMNGEGQRVGFSGCGPDERRQKSPHAHCVQFSHDGGRLYVCDLGSDRIHVLTKTDSGFIHTGSIVTRGGYGPRMICLNGAGTIGYVICELSGMVLVVDLAGESPVVIQEIEADRWHSRGSGDVRLSPDGRFLYASVRLANDGIAIFHVDPLTGSLTYSGYQPTGSHPRNFLITGSGKHLLAACRDANAVEVYCRDSETGELRLTGNRVTLPRVVCIRPR